MNCGLSFSCSMKSGASPRSSSVGSAAAAAVVTPTTVIAATTTVVTAPPISTAAEKNDDEQNDPAAVTAPTVVPTAHRNFTSSIIWRLQIALCRHPKHPMLSLPGWFRLRGILSKKLLNLTGVIAKCRKNLIPAGRLPAAPPVPQPLPAIQDPGADAAKST